MPTQTTVAMCISDLYLIGDNNPTGRTLTPNTRKFKVIHLHILNNSFFALAESQIRAHRMDGARVSAISTGRFASAAIDHVKAVGGFV